MSSDSITVKYNQAELRNARDMINGQHLITKVLRGATGMTHLKRQV